MRKRAASKEEDKEFADVSYSMQFCHQFHLLDLLGKIRISTVALDQISQPHSHRTHISCEAAVACYTNNSLNGVLIT